MRRRVKRHAIRNLVFALFSLTSCGGMRMACVGLIAGLFARRDVPYVGKCRNANRPAIDPWQVSRRVIRQVIRNCMNQRHVMRRVNRRVRRGLLLC